MNEAIGNLWTYPAQYRVITTNGVVMPGCVLVMGKGVALQAKQRFPDLPRKLGEHITNYGNRVFFCGTEGIISFPTKNDWRQPSCLKLITTSTEQLVTLADKFGIQSVVMPRPGCGNGGLNWADVRPILESRLDHRFTVLANG